jgi:hypothetical protein
MSEQEEVTVTSIDAVNMAADGDVNGFKSAINDLLMDKVRDAVDVKRYDVQANFMSQDEPEEVETTTEE